MSTDTVTESPVTESTPSAPAPSSVRSIWTGPIEPAAWRTPQHWVRLVVGGVPMLLIGAWAGSHILR